MSVAWKRKSGVVLVVLAAVVLTGCIRFAAPATLSISGTTSLADVTGDGTADLLVDNGGSLTRYDYCGTGCLQPKESFSGQDASLIADFSGDGVADVLTWGGAYRVLFGGVNGLGNAVTLPSTPDPSVIAAGDFNGDGKADLVRRGASYPTGRFVVYLGDGIGGFTASTLVATFPITEGLGPEIDVGDIDGDGHDDLVMTYFGFLGVYRLGDPSCSQGTCSYFFTSVDGANLTFGDINSDGRDDFATATSQGIVFYRSTGTGFTPFPAFQTITLPASTFEMGLRDVDNDGLTDFLLNDGANPRTWWSGTNDGGFPIQAVSAVPVQASGCRDCMGDVDGDGDLDAVAGDQIWVNTSF